MGQGLRDNEFGPGEQGAWETKVLENGGPRGQQARGTMGLGDSGPGGQFFWGTTVLWDNRPGVPGYNGPTLFLPVHSASFTPDLFGKRKVEDVVNSNSDIYL